MTSRFPLRVGASECSARFHCCNTLLLHFTSLRKDEGRSSHLTGMYVSIVRACAYQALAESMGIETDWNCAISLRPLEDSSQPDPHRMKSNYADWDVKVSVVLAALDPCNGGNTGVYLRWVGLKRPETMSRHRSTCTEAHIGRCLAAFWLTRLKQP